MYTELHLIIVIDLRRGQCQDVAGLRLVFAYEAKKCGRGIVQPARANGHDSLPGLQDSVFNHAASLQLLHVHRQILQGQLQ